MKKIHEEISQNRTALSNASSLPEIATRMAAFGYQAKKFQEGKALVENTDMLHSLKKDKHDRRLYISQTLKADTKACRKLYMAHVKVARQSFEQASGVQRQLGIDRAIPQAVSQWLPLAYGFYTKLQEIHDQMTRFTIPAAEVSQGKTMVDAILAQREARYAKKGEAEASTHSRDIVMKEMRAWMKDFYSVARVALKDHPQWLEALGIKVPRQKV